MSHFIPSSFLERTVSITLVGAGGNGGPMLTGLAKMHRAMRALGHPGGFQVTAYDPDTVSESNVERQGFSPADIGFFKSVVRVHRLNLFYGLDWTARPELYHGRSSDDGPAPADIIIGCVDTARARRGIHKALDDKRAVTPSYWLDLGNGQSDGQVVLGQPVAYKLDSRGRPHDMAKPANRGRLPVVTELFPDILSASFPEDDAPSCSHAEALGKQELFINQECATHALKLLWQLFRHGQIDYHGCVFSATETNYIPVPNTVEIREAA